MRLHLKLFNILAAMWTWSLVRQNMAETCTQYVSLSPTHTHKQARVCTHTYTQNQIENYVIIIYILFGWYPPFKFILRIVWSTSSHTTQLPGFRPLIVRACGGGRRSCLKIPWHAKKKARTTIVATTYINCSGFIQSVNEMRSERCASRTPLFWYVICLIGTFYRVLCSWSFYAADTRNFSLTRQLCRIFPFILLRRFHFFAAFYLFSGQINLFRSVSGDKMLTLNILPRSGPVQIHISSAKKSNDSTRLFQSSKCMQSHKPVLRNATSKVLVTGRAHAPCNEKHKWINATAKWHHFNDMKYI